MKHALIFTALLATALTTACSNATDETQAIAEATPKITAQAASVKLYALECGRINMLDLGLFASNGAFDGQTNEATSSCYLIRHPQGDLLWDTGMPDALNAIEGGMTNGPFHVSVPKTLSGQLTDLGLAPADIEYLSISHSHFDHVGNAGTYAASTLIVHEAELAHMFRDEAKADAQSFAAYSALENSQKITFTGEHDVFGDGTVTIIDTPGHTPGHTVLKLNLANAGNILLSGDLYHLNKSRDLRTVPVFNTDEAETLHSMDKFEALAKELNAKVIIQHSMADFDALPKPPEYID